MKYLSRQEKKCFIKKKKNNTLFIYIYSHTKIFLKAGVAFQPIKIIHANFTTTFHKHRHLGRNMLGKFNLNLISGLYNISLLHALASNVHLTVFKDPGISFTTDCQPYLFVWRVLLILVHLRRDLQPTVSSWPHTALFAVFLWRHILFLLQLSGLGCFVLSLWTTKVASL